MSYNTSMVVADLKDIKRKHFKEAIFLAYKGGITSVAPLGFCGDTIMIHGNDRKQQVSIRNYGNDAELLITNNKGHFLFYGRYHVNLGVEKISTLYFNIFKTVRQLMDTDELKRPDFANLSIPSGCSKTIGFDMMNAYQRSLGGLLV